MTRNLILALSAMVALAACTPSTQPPDAATGTDGSPAAQANGSEGSPDVVKARDLLDRWSGQREILIEAHGLLSAERERNGESPELLMQMARLAVMSGVRGGNEEALRLIDEGQRIDPYYPDLHVLEGHVLTNLDRIGEAHAALDRAEALRSTSPWLKLNRATLHSERGDIRAAAELCAEVIESGSTNPKVLGAAWQCQVPWQRRQRDFAALERGYKARLEIDRSAWALSEYAKGICLDQNRCTEALPLAREAQERMDYGYGRLALAAALYSMWGEDVATHGAGSAVARARLAEAQALMPDVDEAMALYGGKAGNATLVPALMAAGADIDAVCASCGMSALSRAAELGDLESLKVLIGHGADINTESEEWGALVRATREGRLEIVEALLAAGVDERANPTLALQLAGNGRPAILERLTQRFPDLAKAL